MKATLGATVRIHIHIYSTISILDSNFKSGNKLCNEHASRGHRTSGNVSFRTVLVPRRKAEWELCELYAKEDKKSMIKENIRTTDRRSIKDGLNDKKSFNSSETSGSLTEFLNVENTVQI